jgi:uncharacterized SAM-binding protein YcdF (DUF218 family)
LQKLKIVLALALLFGAVWFGRDGILVWAGSYLVEVQEPQKADLIVVLGGDATGFRVLKGCQLLERGYANQVWMSGSMSMYGKAESELAAEFAATRGCAADKITPLKMPVDSTRDEARQIGKMMREKGIHKYLLVTSNYHTRRSGNVFRQESPDIDAIVIAADDNDFPVDSWWKQRHSRKTAFYEWIKTVSYWVGL